MHWVVQGNMYNEEGFSKLLSAIERLELPHSVVKVIPFIGELQPDVDPSGKVVVMGTHAMSRVARKKGWLPGAWLDNLDYEIQRLHWGTEMLNHDAVVNRLGDVEGWVDPKFVRPTEDLKSFAGRVMDWGDFEEWRSRVSALPPEDNPTVTCDTRIMVCSTKKIHSETRVWVIRGEPVTASGYKRGRRVVYSSQVDPRVLFYARKRAQEWSPNEAYCMDVADTPDGLKIMEAGNLNSCGFYHGDMQKLVMAIEGNFS